MSCSMEEGSANSCQICGKNATSKCTNCRKACYCSREHQKKDWKQHKGFCFPAKVVTNPELGRYFVASRDISECEVILKEAPLFSGPSGKLKLTLCLVCYGVIQDDSACPKCRWPIHTSCLTPGGQNAHSQNECSIFASQGIGPEGAAESLIYEKIAVLRGCLLKITNSEKWAQLKTLEGHPQARKKVEELNALSLSMISFIRDRCKLAQTLTVEEIDHVVGVVVVNAYVTEDNLTSSPGFKCGSFVFHWGSMPAHSCIPNCKWVIQDHKLSLYALSNIKEGACLSHCYSWGGCGTLERQKHLLKSKFFCCGCARCQDPTELGTYFSALKCGCGGGHFLPLDSTNVQSVWKCKSCQKERSGVEITAFVEEMRGRHEKVSPDNSLEAVGALEALRQELLTKVHLNHYVLAEIEQDILVRLSLILAEGDGKLDKLVVANRMIELSSQCLKLMEIIAPGATSHVGRQLYYLQMGMGVIIMDQIQRGENSPELRQEVEHWQGIRRRGVKILQMESQGREEYVLGQAMIDQSNSNSTP